MDEYFRSKITGKILKYPYMLDYIYGEGTVMKEINRGLLEKIDPPSIEEALKDGTKIIAVMRYRDIHKCTLKEAKEAVEKIIEEKGVESNETYC